MALIILLKLPFILGRNYLNASSDVELSRRTKRKINAHLQVEDLEFYSMPWKEMRKVDGILMLNALKYNTIKINSPKDEMIKSLWEAHHQLTLKVLQKRKPFPCLFIKSSETSRNGDFKRKLKSMVQLPPLFRRTITSKNLIIEI